MKFALSLIFLLLLGCASSFNSNELPTKENQYKKHKFDYILIEMKELNKNIWVLDVEDGDVKFEEGSKYVNLTRSSRSMKYETFGDMTFEANGVRVNVKDLNVFLNGRSMENSLNVIIDSKRNVRIGEFYRTFE
nr:hypothetical protein [uncultured Undibacterium sp.]